MDTKIDARLAILPKRSQIFVISLLVLSGLAFCAGCLFLWHEKPNALIPFSFSAGFCLSAALAWWFSHRNADLDGAAPTRVLVKQAEVLVETDARTLASGDSFRLFEQCLLGVGHRVPLPEPDGMVSPSGTPQPEKKMEAIEVTRRVNEEAAEIAKLVSASHTQTMAAIPRIAPEVPTSLQSFPP